MKWPSRRIIIPASVAKALRRPSVTINETLADWLAPCRRSSGPIVPPNLRRRRVSVATAAEISWKGNGPRHSFASYHLTMWRNSAGTAPGIGHRGSIQILFDHYVDVVSKEDAEQFWGLQPGVEENRALRLVS